MKFFKSEDGNGYSRYDNAEVGYIWYGYPDRLNIANSYEAYNQSFSTFSDEESKKVLFKKFEDEGWLKVTTSQNNILYLSKGVIFGCTFSGKEAWVGTPYKFGFNVVTNKPDEVKALRDFLESQMVEPEPEPEPEVTPADFFHDPAGFYASYVEWAKEHPFPSK